MVPLARDGGRIAGPRRPSYRRRDGPSGRNAAGCGGLGGVRARGWPWRRGSQVEERGGWQRPGAGITRGHDATRRVRRRGPRSPLVARRDAAAIASPTGRGASPRPTTSNLCPRLSQIRGMSRTWARSGGSDRGGRGLDREGRAWFCPRACSRTGGNGSLSFVRRDDGGAMSRKLRGPFWGFVVGRLSDHGVSFRAPALGARPLRASGRAEDVGERAVGDHLHASRPRTHASACSVAPTRSSRLIRAGNEPTGRAQAATVRV